MAEQRALVSLLNLAVKAFVAANRGQQFREVRIVAALHFLGANLGRRASLHREKRDNVAGIRQGQRAELAVEKDALGAIGLLAARQAFPSDLLATLELVADKMGVGRFLVVLEA